MIEGTFEEYEGLVKELLAQAMIGAATVIAVIGREALTDAELMNLTGALTPLLLEVMNDCAPRPEVDRAELDSRAREIGIAVASKMFGPNAVERRN